MMIECLTRPSMMKTFFTGIADIHGGTDTHSFKTFKNGDFTGIILFVLIDFFGHKKTYVLLLFIIIILL